jgi:hypothetical protein
MSVRLIFHLDLELVYMVPTSSTHRGDGCHGGQHVAAETVVAAVRRHRPQDDVLHRQDDLGGRERWRQGTAGGRRHDHSDDSAPYWQSGTVPLQDVCQSHSTPMGAEASVSDSMVVEEI